jgi:predicted dehydrogenase
MSDTLRVGVIGAGGNTRKLHIPGLQRQKGVEVVAVANRTRASGAAVAAEFGIETVCDSWDEIIDDPTIDAVCIGTWPYMHAPLTVAALDAGKHVLCEARMAMNSGEAHAMLEASQMCPTLVAQIVPAPLTFPLDRTIIDMVGNGYIGDVISIDARVALGSNFPLWDAPYHWRMNRELSGNNIMSLGIWYECLMRWVGPARTVQAIGQSVVKHRRDDEGRRVAMTIPDHIDIIGELEQGGQMRLALSSAVGHMPGVDIYLCGTEGTLRISGEAGQLQLEAGTIKQKSLSPVKIAKSKQGGWRVEEEFVNAVFGNEQVRLTDFATGVRYMEWTDAVTAAVRTGKNIHLPLDVAGS